MKFLRKFAAGDIEGNASYKMRQKRFSIFKEFINNKMGGDDTFILLDIGGSNYYWEHFKKFLDKRIKLFLINIERDAMVGYPGIVGDARNLAFLKSSSVDLILSNSLIEHLGGYEEQKQFAKEIQRVGRFYFLQTPAFLFPLEPHFLFPFFHWLPKSVRLFLATRFSLGWYQKAADINEAKKMVEEIRIMKKKELRKIFPNANILTEYWGIFPKSYMVIGKGHS